MFRAAYKQYRAIPRRAFMMQILLVSVGSMVTITPETKNPTTFEVGKVVNLTWSYLISGDDTLREADIIRTRDGIVENVGYLDKNGTSHMYIAFEDRFNITCTMQEPAKCTFVIKNTSEEDGGDYTFSVKTKSRYSQTSTITLEIVSECSLIYEDCSKNTIKLLWIIIFAALGALIILVILGSITCWIRKKRKRKRKRKDSKNAQEGQDSEEGSLTLHDLPNDAPSGDGLYDVVNQAYEHSEPSSYDGSRISLEPYSEVSNGPSVPSMPSTNANKSKKNSSKGKPDQVPPKHVEVVKGSKKKKNKEVESNSNEPPHPLVNKSKQSKKKSGKTSDTSETHLEHQAVEATNTQEEENEEEEQSEEHPHVPPYAVVDLYERNDESEGTIEETDQAPPEPPIVDAANTKGEKDQKEENLNLPSYAVVDKSKKKKKKSETEGEPDLTPPKHPAVEAANTNGEKDEAQENISLPSYAVVDKSKKNRKKSETEREPDLTPAEHPVMEAADTREEKGEAQENLNLPSYAVVDKSKKNRKKSETKGQTNQMLPEHSPVEAANTKGEKEKEEESLILPAYAVVDKSKKNRKKSETEKDTSLMRPVHPVLDAANTMGEKDEAEENLNLPSYAVVDKSKKNRKKSEGGTKQSLHEGPVAGAADSNRAEENLDIPSKEETRQTPLPEHPVADTANKKGKKKEAVVDKSKNSRKRSAAKGETNQALSEYPVVDAANAMEKKEENPKPRKVANAKVDRFDETRSLPRMPTSSRTLPPNTRPVSHTGTDNANTTQFPTGDAAANRRRNTVGQRVANKQSTNPRPKVKTKGAETEPEYVNIAQMRREKAAANKRRNIEGQDAVNRGRTSSENVGAKQAAADMEARDSPEDVI